MVFPFWQVQRTPPREWKRYALDNIAIFYHKNKANRVALWGLGGKASASFNTAALQNLAAIFSRVALHKAMFDFALAFVWLISSFRHSNFFPLVLLTDNLLQYTVVFHFFQGVFHSFTRVWRFLWKTSSLLGCGGFGRIGKNRDETVEKSEQI